MMFARRIRAAIMFGDTKEMRKSASYYAEPASFRFTVPVETSRRTTEDGDSSGRAPSSVGSWTGEPTR